MYSLRLNLKVWTFARSSGMFCTLPTFTLATGLLFFSHLQYYLTVVISSSHTFPKLCSMHNIKLSINCILTCTMSSPPLMLQGAQQFQQRRHMPNWHTHMIRHLSENCFDWSLSQTPPPPWLTKYVVPPHSPGAAISPLAQREMRNARWLEKRRSRRPFKIITLNMQISEEPRWTPAKTLGKVDYAQSVWADESQRSPEEKKTLV